jgi:hypothetical protein
MLDLTNATTATIVTALLMSIFAWAYSKWVLKESNPEKVLAKSVLTGLVAVSTVLLVAYNQSASHSLRSEPFFVSVM